MAGLLKLSQPPVRAEMAHDWPLADVDPWQDKLLQRPSSSA